MRVVCFVRSCELISHMNYDRMQHEGHQSMLAIILLQFRRPPLSPLFPLFKVLSSKNQLGKGAKKKEKKLTSVSFMYVCVAGNGEMSGFFLFFPNNSLIDNSLSG